MIHSDDDHDPRDFCVYYSFDAYGNRVEIEELPADDLEPVEGLTVLHFTGGTLDPEDAGFIHHGVGLGCPWRQEPYQGVWLSEDGSKIVLALSLPKSEFAPTGHQTAALTLASLIAVNLQGQATRAWHRELP